ncbi:threonylcarbamoyl-AMP synthase [bacterium]|nr:MAG: threonylcarbamoyl-AMP synthase [bacterium]
MKTVILTIDSKVPEPRLIRQAAAYLQQGELVAFPTETVYGLGANALSSKAIRKIFKAKGRPSDNPLIIHIADKKQLYALAKSVPPSAEKLIRKFWPGPLTIVFKKSDVVPSEISAGLNTVAIRLPKHKIARELIRGCGFPLAAPSANCSGKPSPTDAAHVIHDLNSRIACVIDGGPTLVGLESTVIDLTKKVPVILRPGKITQNEIRKIIGNVTLHPTVRSNRKIVSVTSPGMKYRHYAPKAKLKIIRGNTEAVEKKVRSIVHRSAAKNIAVLVTDRNRIFRNVSNVFIGSSAQQIAKNLFRVLRRMDDKKIELILIESLPEDGFGLAVMNRLKKAAGFNIINAR